MDPISSAPAITARVVIAEDLNATDAFQANLGIVRSMLDRGLTNYFTTTNTRSAWQGIVKTQDVIGIKVYSTPGAFSGTRPAVIEALVSSLGDAGIPPRQIIVWDKSENDLRNAGFFELAERLGFRVAASTRTGWDATNFYETALLGTPIFGDHEFEQKGDGVGRKSFVSKLVSQEITRHISVAPLLNHNDVSVSGNLYSLAMGSVDNAVRFENHADRLSEAVPEIYALPVLGERVVLNITDALICQYEGGARGLLHYSVALNQLRFSRDPVALDVLSIRELERRRREGRAEFVKPNLELYRNATLLELGTSDVNKIRVEWAK